MYVINNTIIYVHICLPSGVSSLESSDKYTSLSSLSSHSFYPIDIIGKHEAKIKIINKYIYIYIYMLNAL